MLHFVVLTHDHPDWHWDFMLEKDASLRTWRLAIDPLSVGPVQAKQLPDHRLEYLEYEGPVSGGRGEVRRWDSGSYQILVECDNKLVIQLLGQRLNGVARIEDQNGETVFQFVAE